nr:acetoacetate decarboxylase [Thiohalocapsa marina]
MDMSTIRRQAFAMPFGNPAYPPGPYRFVDREYFILTYRTDADKLRAVVPEPLELAEPLVHYEFIRMPDSTGFGDYTESGQVIAVQFNDQPGNYTHAMYLGMAMRPLPADASSGGGFPKKLATPRLAVHTDTLVGTMDYERSIPGRFSAVSARRPISCSRSSPMSTARRASASWCAMLSPMSGSKVPGAGLGHWPCFPMHWRPWPSCPSWRWSRPGI